MNDPNALSRSRNPLKLLGAYDEEHRHPINRALHAIGIPLVVLSAVFLISPWRPFGWSRLVSLASFAGGWVLLWSGHIFFEKNLPATFTNPSVLVTAPVWWMRRAIRLVRSGSLSR